VARNETEVCKRSADFQICKRVLVSVQGVVADVVGVCLRECRGTRYRHLLRSMIKLDIADPKLDSHNPTKKVPNKNVKTNDNNVYLCCVCLQTVAR